MLEKLISEVIDEKNQIDFYLAIIEALRKEIPREPKENADWLYCPICGREILMDRFNYCPDCGQKIDWRCLDDDEEGSN